MSSVDLLSRTGAPAAPAASFSGTHPRTALGLAIVAAGVLGQLTALSTVTTVWTTGAFFDTDDAMRAVEVRDLIAGQSWFDMTATRLAPPAGVFMHWSRIVDVPLVLLIKVFGLLADPVVAERLARLTFPLLLTFALFALLVPLCERLLGPAVRLPALAAAFLSGPAVGQFEPGRIDHHAPQIVLLTICIGALVHAVISERSSRATWAGVATALSLGISVENIPFFALVFAWLTFVWVAKGRDVAALLTWFAAGLAGTLPLVYAATIAPARWLIVVPDALSLAQASAALAGAAFLATLAMARHSFRDDMRGRAIVAVVGGALTAALLAHAFPVLAHDPFADLDPLVRSAWLDGVGEAQPLLRKGWFEPLWTAGVLVPALLALAGTLAMIAQTSEWRRRAAWSLLALALLAGIAASCLMVRTLSTTLTIAVPGALALALAIGDRLARRGPLMHGPVPLLLLLLAVSPMGWAIAADRLKPAGRSTTTSETSAARRGFERCTSPGAYSDLAQLPSGLVLAEPDLGSFILAQTHHSVLAGAYHRDADAMRFALETLLGDPDAIATRMRQANARYLVVCRDSTNPVSANLAAHLEQASKADEPARGLRHLAARSSVLEIFTTR